jgi:hypothetical protein
MVTMTKFINPFKIQIHGDTNKNSKEVFSPKATSQLKIEFTKFIHDHSLQ